MKKHLKKIILVAALFVATSVQAQVQYTAQTIFTTNWLPGSTAIGGASTAYSVRDFATVGIAISCVVSNGAALDTCDPGAGKNIVYATFATGPSSTVFLPNQNAAGTIASANQTNKPAINHTVAFSYGTNQIANGVTTGVFTNLTLANEGWIKLLYITNAGVDTSKIGLTNVVVQLIRKPLRSLPSY